MQCDLYITFLAFADYHHRILTPHCGALDTYARTPTQHTCADNPASSLNPKTATRRPLALISVAAYSGHFPRLLGSTTLFPLHLYLDPTCRPGPMTHASRPVHPSPPREPRLPRTPIPHTSGRFDFTTPARPPTSPYIYSKAL
jgi:hypothetical protein